MKSFQLYSNFHIHMRISFIVYIIIRKNSTDCKITRSTNVNTIIIIWECLFIVCWKKIHKTCFYIAWNHDISTDRFKHNLVFYFIVKMMLSSRINSNPFYYGQVIHFNNLLHKLLKKFLKSFLFVKPTDELNKNCFNFQDIVIMN